MRRFAALCVCLLCLLLPTAAMAAEDLLSNGAFTSLTELPQDWYADAWYSGGEDYRVDVDGSGADTAVHIQNLVDNDARFCHTVTVEPESSYILSCEIKTKGVERGAGANVSIEGTLAASAPILGDTDWQRVELVGKTAKDQTEMTVCVRVGGYGALSCGEAWFRNVSLVKTADTAEAAVFSVAEVEPAENYTTGKVPYFGAMLLSCLCAGGAFFALARCVINKKETLSAPSQGGSQKLALLLGGAFVVRVVLSLLFYGHPTDINCFMAWGNAIAENGITTFYTSGMFADYPPGYMYVLGAMSGMAKLLGLSYGSDGYALLTKMPAILADIASAYIVYRMAERRFSQRTALWLCAAVAFDPVMAFVSGGWGQIDSILALLLFAALWLFLEDRLVWAGAVFGLAILIKPQALMLGPLFAVAYFARVKSWKDAGRTAVAVGAALGVILLLALPFGKGQAPDWLLGKYFSTATSYPYASVEAFNLMALLGGNWQSVDNGLFLLTYGEWGTVFIVLSVLFSSYLYIRARKTPGALWLCAAWLLCALFTLGQYMHERYLFPVLLLLLVAFIVMGDRRLFYLYGLFSVSLLLNVLAAFVIVEHQDARGAQYEALTMLGSLATVGGFGYFTYVCVDVLWKGRVQPAFTSSAPMRETPATPLVTEASTETGGRLFDRRDRIFCWGLTLLYTVLTLVNLGTLHAPERAWQGQAGDSVTIELGTPTALSAVWVYGGISAGTLTLTAEDGTQVQYEQIYDDMFRWVPVEITALSDRLTLHVDTGRVCFNEISILDAAGNAVQATAPGGEALLDEGDTVPQAPSYYNGMYFDELYHGRTAYEHLHGLVPYENSHPPLGKVFIMLGIAVCGMDPFGWRIVGALFGVGMLPILYAFAKRLFKKSEYALLAAGLFALDFMHFTQTRIATIDVYAVFFILLMYDFMYQYYCMDFFRDGLKKTLKPLALAGVFFGMGTACKWTCIYAGGGLAVIFFTSLVQRYGESRRLKASKNAEERALGARFGQYAVYTLLWCCLFYILVPVGIYLLSYLPYCLSQAQYDLKGIWTLQEFMFSYHSGLTATHPYQSAWWQWPLDLRPTWYYVGYSALDSSRAGTISAFGNPAVWWVCSAGLVVLILRLMRDKLKPEPGMFVLLTAAAANYLPWVLVPRCTFTYHYFPMIPFIILATVYLVRDMDARHPERYWWKWAWLGVCALLFALFYPVLSGAEVPIRYIRALEWLPTWTFLGY